MCNVRLDAGTPLARLEIAEIAYSPCNEVFDLVGGEAGQPGQRGSEKRRGVEGAIFALALAKLDARQIGALNSARFFGRCRFVGFRFTHSGVELVFASRP